MRKGYDSQGNIMNKLNIWIYRMIVVMFLCLFLPVLFSTIMFGTSMQYLDRLKLYNYLPNSVLALLSIGVMAILMLLMNWERKRIGKTTPKGGKWREFWQKNKNVIENLILIVGFIIIFIVNVKVSRQIAFRHAYDVDVVTGAAYKIAKAVPLEYDSYFSMYPNNLPIIYFMGRTFRFAMNHFHSGYPYELIWIEIGCFSVSMAGYFACMLIKKITHNTVALLATLMIVGQLVLLSPWKMVPYTDSFGVAFAVMAVYFYISYLQEMRLPLKVVGIILSVGSAYLGGLVKPSVNIILIAILGCELLELIFKFKEKCLYFFLEICLVLLLLTGWKSMEKHIISEIGFDYNPEISVSWQHYLAMGMGEESTGAYDAYFITFIGSYQDDIKARNEAYMAYIADTLQERGILGTAHFYLRKMVMTFNDATFCWATASSVNDYYPETMARNDWLTDLLRSIYWPDGKMAKTNNTFSQFLWILCLLGVPGCLLNITQERNRTLLILPVSFLGFFLYQMLFEARARYLFVFAPLLIVIAIWGIYQYSEIGPLGKKQENE